ncbi:MAG: hypothetical protein JWQ18_1131 [Conexibacter sp.]|nr:hypothetical protein [Conexibacter sp.]
MTPLAHAGRWAAGILYLLPVLLVAGALNWQSLKDRRRGDHADELEGLDEATLARFRRE